MAVELIRFPDVSHYQAGLRLDGAPAVIAKATQGTGFVDPSYVDFKAQAASLAIPFCAYHWVDSSNLAGQANLAYSVVGRTPMMWDAEAAGSDVARLVELTSRYRALGGVVHLVYLPHWWWAGHLGSADLTPLATAGLRLVSSNYPAAGYTDTGPGWAAYGGVAPVQWQYANAQAFNGARVDFNAFKGTATEWLALVSGEDAMTPAQAYVQHVMNYRLEAILHNRSTVSVPAFTNGGQSYPGFDEPNLLAGEFVAVRATLDALSAALARIGAGGVDVAAVLAGVDTMLANLRTGVNADVRDAVADLGEGGAAAVRAQS